jgi:hypothetical protein
LQKQMTAWLYSSKKSDEECYCEIPLQIIRNEKSESESETNFWMNDKLWRIRDHKRTDVREIWVHWWEKSHSLQERMVVWVELTKQNKIKNKWGNYNKKKISE